MSDGYDVDPATLAEHAARVSQVADRVERAAQAAKTVGVGDFGVYGALPGAILVPAFDVLFGDNVEIIGSTADMGDAYADAIRGMSDSYQELEQRNADLFGKLGIREQS